MKKQLSTFEFMTLQEFILLKTPNFLTSKHKAEFIKAIVQKFNPIFQNLTEIKANALISIYKDSNLDNQYDLIKKIRSIPVKDYDIFMRDIDPNNAPQRAALISIVDQIFLDAYAEINPVKHKDVKTYIEETVFGGKDNLRAWAKGLINRMEITRILIIKK